MIDIVQGRALADTIAAAIELGVDVLTEDLHDAFDPLQAIAAAPWHSEHDRLAATRAGFVQGAARLLCLAAIADEAMGR